jgi:cytoskeletal protein CcmA (bactofilin family)
MKIIKASSGLKGDFVVEGQVYVEDEQSNIDGTFKSIGIAQELKILTHKRLSGKVGYKTDGMQCSHSVGVLVLATYTIKGHVTCVRLLNSSMI